MTKVIAIVASLVFGVVGLNAYLYFNQNDSREVSVLQLSQRLQTLEEQLEEETKKREELEFVIAQLNIAERNDFSVNFSDDSFDEAAASTSNKDDSIESSKIVSESPEARREAYRERMRTRNDPIRKITRLEEAGFPRDQANWIIQKEREIQLDNLNNRWERQHQDYLENPEKFDLNAGNSIRAELGEQGYEKYLKANGRATSVRVNQVLENSPAAYAGLQAGDEILRYSGQRVFNFSELNTVTVQGEKGSPVIVDVMRNGSVVQLTVERGPIGISSRRGRRGF